MCVQMDGTEDLAVVAVRFHARRTMVEASSGKVRPTDRAPSLVQGTDGRRLGWMHWGWEHADPVVTAKRPELWLHARFETAAVKPTWREAFARRRCAIITRGWWEVQPQPGKQRGIPFYYASG